MPTYDYKCLECENIFEEFQKITDEPLKECPKCGGGVRRLISGGAGLIFKGSGFYTTDYKRQSAPKETCPSAESSSNSACSNCPAAGEAN
jgi:putative FmdB family regulatory protein